MKKIFLFFSIALVLVVLFGADIRRDKSSSPQTKRSCFGYTIIEFGKGIDCNGDTVKLIQKEGAGQILARNWSPTE